MTVAAAIGGPVSAALEADLRDWTRRHGIVVWLDLDNHYSAFVDRLVDARNAGDLPYDVRAFRGSHLALMLSLEGLAGGAEKVPLVVHLPGFNEESVHDTPLLELYDAGTRYRKALETLITEAAAGRVRPDQIAAFTDQPGVTLDSADAWLAALLQEGEGGIAAHLRAMQPASGPRRSAERWIRRRPHQPRRGRARDLGASGRLDRAAAVVAGRDAASHRLRAPKTWPSSRQAGRSASSTCTT